jgi:hypothetical protein
MTVLRGVLKLARELGHITSVPEIRLARVQAPEMARCTDEEYAQLQGAAAAFDAHAHLAILLAGDAGLRVG